MSGYPALCAACLQEIRVSIIASQDAPDAHLFSILIPSSRHQWHLLKAIQFYSLELLLPLKFSNARDI